MQRGRIGGGLSLALCRQFGNTLAPLDAGFLRLTVPDGPGARPWPLLHGIEVAHSRQETK